jgi:4-amino-4-deoxy-L-arabinose transferase-like glycosyltransferase
MTAPVSPASFLASKYFKAACWALILLGVFLRFYHITQNDFVFYDEGMYLEHNRDLLNKIKQYPAKNFTDSFAIIKILFNSALMTAKWLWFFISNLRVFFGGPEAYYFTRVVSALCGVATIFISYLFSRRYFKSAPIALLSAVLLAVLPSHVFYSRLAMQESLSTLCLIAGLYLYFSNRDFGWRALAAGVLFSAVFFTNYRMIVLPVLLVVAEAVEALSGKRQVNWVKLGGTILMFAAMVYWIGSLNEGSNRFITWAWMSRQAQLAPQQWHWVNVFSYPYYLFALEGVLFFLAFFLNLYWVVKKQWSRVLPFALMITQMLIFTFASEKGARYLCVVLPFAAMAAAVAFYEIVLNNPAVQRLRWAPILLCAALILTPLQKSWAIARSGSAYDTVAGKIREKDPQAKMLATQPLILGLFSRDVVAAPKTVRDMIILFAQGHRYLIIDPQAYVSWTASNEKFTPQLIDYLGFIRDHMPPVYVADHLNRTMLERFVLDHNENLVNSVRFLNVKAKDFGAIYVYDLKECLQTMQRVSESIK